ncbi:MAG: flagellar hook assembly protein FlgD [Gammaproteobacteria bacterium]|nr:flagellar hook assembly protein FlgD [Gammaproteobacteria bacterium]MDP2139342.1 flagellar hook assembly protein FlgD [Gammaproteobacteria bacterium]MDP2346899.1 flagellar hook assembly protein FlgD [Gammaproteobacteria bacterium]
MSDVTNAGGTALSRVLSEYAHKEPDKKRNEMGRDEFLKLLVAQLENQDPTNPQENGEFVAQLAQFSSLEESQKLTAGFDKFATAFQSTQTLQATSLVGRPVHVKSDFTMLDASNAVSVLAEMDAPMASASLSVYSSSGELVDSFELGPQSSGRNEFIWTGHKANGERFPPGLYSFSVTGSMGGEATSVPIYLSANVNSVTIEPGGSLKLNLAAIGPTSLSEVIQIN